jgi:hypothetical protein
MSVHPSKTAADMEYGINRKMYIDLSFQSTQGSLGEYPAPYDWQNHY